MEEINLWLSALSRKCEVGETKTALEAAKELRKAALRAVENRLGKSVSKESRRSRRRSRSPRRRDRSRSRSRSSDSSSSSSSSEEDRSRRKKSRRDEPERRKRRSPSPRSDDERDGRAAPRKGQAQLTKKRPTNADSDAESEYSDHPANQAPLRPFLEVMNDRRQCSLLGDWDPHRLFTFRVLFETIHTPRSLKFGLPRRVAVESICRAFNNVGLVGVDVPTILGYVSTLWRVFDIDSHKQTKIPDMLWMRGKVPILPALLILKAHYVFDLSGLGVAAAPSSQCRVRAQPLKTIEEYLVRTLPELSGNSDAVATILNLALDPHFGFLQSTSFGKEAFLKSTPLFLLPEMLSWLRESYTGDPWMKSIFQGRWRTWSHFDAEFQSIIDYAEAQGYIKQTVLLHRPAIQYVPDRVWQEAYRYR